MLASSAHEAFEECNRTILNKPQPTDGLVYCPRTFDGLVCWDDTPAGERTTQHCPVYAGGGFDPDAIAFKDCTANGTWWEHPFSNQPWTNYSLCVDSENLEGDKQVLYLYISGYSISIFFLLIALGIFFYYRQLQCDRVLIHQHLFISYILTGVVWILSYTLIYLDHVVLLNNPIWCRILHVTTHYCTLCNYFWMFCEGLYLHTIIVTPFNPGNKLMWVTYGIGWVLPIVPTAIYAGIRSTDTLFAQRCWINRSNLLYIVLGPIFVSLAVNLLFLVNIVRILLTKLRANYARETCQTRKAVRATLILVPLLGLQYIMFPVQPSADAPGYLAYKSIAAFLASFQGFFVSLLFCFLNGEVRNLLERKWRKRFKHQGSSRRSKKSSGGAHVQVEMSSAPAYYTSAPQGYTQDYIQSMTAQEELTEARMELLQVTENGNDEKTNGKVSEPSDKFIPTEESDRGNGIGNGNAGIKDHTVSENTK